MQNEESWQDRFLKQDVVGTLSRFAGGALLAASSLLGWPAIVLAGLVSTGLNLFQQQHEKGRKEEMMLNLYRDEIATLLHKDKSSLTIQDLQKAATPKNEGGLGIVTLEKQLDYYAYLRNTRVGVDVAVTAVTAGAVLAIPVLAPATVPYIATIGAGVSGAFSAFLSKIMNATTDAILAQQDYKVSVNKLLLDVTKDLKQKPLHPTKVMGILLIGNEELQDNIRQRYSADYKDLTIYQKMQVVNDMEPTLRVVALTEAINHGHIKPSILGFLAYGQSFEELEGFRKYQDLFREPVQKTTEPTGDSNERTTLHANRVREEKAQTNLPRQLH